MAVPKLPKYLPDKWYEKQRLYYNIYINYVGQTIKHVKRSNVELNQYYDIMFADIDVTNIVGVIVRDPVIDSFTGKPLGLVELDTLLYGFFKVSDNVEADDLIVVELKSVEGALKRFVYEVELLQSWNYEQEVMRKCTLAPIRDKTIAVVYSDEDLDINPPSTEGTRFGDISRLRVDVLARPGKFSVDPEDFDLYPRVTRQVTLEEIQNPVVPSENVPLPPTKIGNEYVYDDPTIDDSIVDHRHSPKFIEELMKSVKDKPPSPFKRENY
jgi:hypothetical protein